MKLFRCTVALAVFSILSCGEKDGKAVNAEKNIQEVNRFVGEWVEVGGDSEIRFIAQGSSFLLDDGKAKFKAEAIGDTSMNVDFSATILGIVVFEYSKENDTISALGDTFSRKK